MSSEPCREGTLDLLEEALAIREGAFDRPDHPARVEAARWLATAHWALAVLGQPSVGVVAPEPARAAAICATYRFDAEKEAAMFFADRVRLYESGQMVPPMPGEGEE